MATMRSFKFLLLILVVLVAVGCAAAPTNDPTQPVPTPTRSARLTPYRSPTASVTSTAALETATPTPIPSPTLTPRTHEVQKGEDLFGIALRYGISLEAIKTANPTVNPQFLSIGARLTIPHAEAPLVTPTPQNAAAITPTPAPVEPGAAHCLPSAEGGAWCFLPVRNPYDFPLENLSALIRLVDADTQAILTQTAFLPLDILPPGATLPLMTFFPPPRPAPYLVSGEILTALPQPTGDGRYLTARVEDLQVTREEGGRSADLRLTVAIAPPDASAGVVRVAAVAYDAENRVIGVRRWESENASPLPGGEALPVTLRVYSISGVIDHVEVFAEARP